MFGAHLNPRWKTGNLDVDTEPDDEGGWRYVIKAHDLPLDSDDGYVDEDEALKAGLEQVEDITSEYDYEWIGKIQHVFREPDYEDSTDAVWWGPEEDPEDATHFTAVRGRCIRRYDYVGGELDNDWRVIEVCLSFEPESKRLRASMGDVIIFERGGSEDLVTHDEVMEEFGNLKRMAPVSNPRPFHVGDIVLRTPEYATASGTAVDARVPGKVVGFAPYNGKTFPLVTFVGRSEPQPIAPKNLRHHPEATLERKQQLAAMAEQYEQVAYAAARNPSVPPSTHEEIDRIRQELYRLQQGEDLLHPGRRR